VVYIDVPKNVASHTSFYNGIINTRQTPLSSHQLHQCTTHGPHINMIYFGPCADSIAHTYIKNQM